MEFSLSRDDLLKPLQWVSSVVDKRQTMAVLQNVLVEVENGVLRLTGTDTEIELIAQIDLDSSFQEGAVTLPGRKAVDWLKQLKAGAEILVKMDDQRVVFKSGRSSSRVGTLPAGDFPNLEDSITLQSLRVDARKLKRLIDKTAFAMAQQDVRYYLNGMLLDIRPELLRLVSTDGHRLALCDMTISGVDQKLQAILPRKAVLELSRLLAEADGDVTLNLGQHHLRVLMNQITFTTKLIDGRFPDYERVLPRDGDKLVLVHREELRAALLRTSVLCNEKFRGLKLLLSPGDLQLTANNAEQEEAEERIAVEYSGPELEIGFNVSYLLDVLAVLEETHVLLTLGGQNSSLLMQEQEARDASYVVMPMRI